MTTPTVLSEGKAINQDFTLPSGKSLHVLDDINLSINPGEIVCLLGPSGCGKSTIMRILAGLIQPSTGEAFYHAEPLHCFNPGVGIVFQSLALYPWMAVSPNVQLPLRAAGRSWDEIHERSGATIKMVGLSGFEASYPRELSGGMKQRVGMARALSID